MYVYDVQIYVHVLIHPFYQLFEQKMIGNPIEFWIWIPKPGIEASEY